MPNDDIEIHRRTMSGMAERYREAYDILFDELDEFSKEKILRGKDYYRNREFARRVIQLAESEEMNYE